MRIGRNIVEPVPWRESDKIRKGRHAGGGQVKAFSFLFLILVGLLAPLEPKLLGTPSAWYPRPLDLQSSVKTLDLQ